MRYAKKTDCNHAEIRDGLRAQPLNYEVVDMSGLGRGIPDLMVKTRKFKRPVWVEIKMPGEKLTTAELAFFEFWPGDCVIVRSLEEAVERLEGKDWEVEGD